MRDINKSDLDRHITGGNEPPARAARTCQFCGEGFDSGQVCPECHATCCLERTSRMIRLAPDLCMQVTEYEGVRYFQRRVYHFYSDDCKTISYGSVLFGDDIPMTLTVEWSGSWGANATAAASMARALTVMAQLAEIVARQKAKLGDSSLELVHVTGQSALAVRRGQVYSAREHTSQGVVDTLIFEDF